MSKEADKVLELDEQASIAPWELKEIDDCEELFSAGVELVCRTPENIALIKEYRTLAPALARRVKELEAERDKLHDALSRCRGQWIHSIHRDRCLEAIGEKEAPK